MEVQPISPHNAVVYITSDDLQSHHLSIESLSAQKLRSVLGTLILPGEKAEIELYPGAGDALVFIRKEAVPPVYYFICVIPRRRQ